jgi:hypothetical protein
MATRRVNVWASCLLACIVSGFTAADAAASAGCEATDTPGKAVSKAGRGQDVAAARTGRIPGLGTVSASVGWDNRATLVLSDRAFTVTRSFTPATREVELAIAGPGEEALVIRFGGTQGIVVSRGAQVLRGASDADALRALVGGPAVAAFRERIGNFERRLNAGAAARFDDPHAYGFLLAGAFVASLAGDPAAFGRARDVMVGRIRGRVQNVRFDFRDCVTEYERYLLKIDDQRTMCLEAANGRDSWYARAADRLGCEAEYMAQILAGEGQFISCTALGVFAS